MGAKVWWKRYLTVGQMIQFWVNMIGICYWFVLFCLVWFCWIFYLFICPDWTLLQRYYLKKTGAVGDCAGDERAFWFGFLMSLSFYLLFQQVSAMCCLIDSDGFCGTVLLENVQKERARDSRTIEKQKNRIINLLVKSAAKDMSCNESRRVRATTLPTATWWSCAVRSSTNTKTEICRKRTWTSSERTRPAAISASNARACTTV